MATVASSSDHLFTLSAAAEAEFVAFVTQLLQSFDLHELQFDPVSEDDNPSTAAFESPTSVADIRVLVASATTVEAVDQAQGPRHLIQRRLHFSDPARPHL